MNDAEAAPGGSRAVRSFLAFDYGTRRVGVATGISGCGAAVRDHACPASWLSIRGSMPSRPSAFW